VSFEEAHEAEESHPEAEHDAEIESYDDDFADDTMHHVPAHGETSSTQEVQQEKITMQDDAEPTEGEHHDVDIEHESVQEASTSPAAEDADPFAHVDIEPSQSHEPEIHSAVHDASDASETADKSLELESEPEQVPEPQVHDAPPDVHHAADIVEPSPDVAAKNVHGSDIEDIVNLLESTSVSRRPPSIASIPDDDD